MLNEALVWIPLFFEHRDVDCSICAHRGRVSTAHNIYVTSDGWSPGSHSHMILSRGTSFVRSVLTTLTVSFSGFFILLSCYHLLTTKLQLIRYTTVPPSQKKMEQDLDATLWLGVEPSFSRKIRIRLIYYRDCLSVMIILTY